MSRPVPRLRRAAAALAVLAAGCSPAEPALEVTPGTRLVYEVDYLGFDQYPFEVTVVRTAPDLVLDYRLAHDSTSAYGRITVSERALRGGHRQYNYWETGRHDVHLRDSTTVWVSDAVYRALAAGRPAPVNLGPQGEPDETLRPVGRETLPVRIGGETVRVPVLVGETESGQKLWVWENPADPVILQIYQRWYLTIREAVPPGEREE